MHMVQGARELYTPATKNAAVHAAKMRFMCLTAVLSTVSAVASTFIISDCIEAKDQVWQSSSGPIEIL